MLKLSIFPKVLSGVAVLMLSLGTIVLASQEPESVVADPAEDIIPLEEMFDEAIRTNFNQGEKTQNIRAITQKEKSTFAQRPVQIKVYKTMRGDTDRQHMDVFVNEKLIYRFTISTAYERKVTGKSGRTYFASTPNGKFVADSFEEKRWSNLWQVNLKYVIRFSGGVWIHATTPDHYKELGAPASGGCVRLHEDDAEQLFKLVNSYGINQVGITIISAPDEPQLKPIKAPGRLILQ